MEPEPLGWPGGDPLLQHLIMYVMYSRMSSRRLLVPGRFIGESKLRHNRQPRSARVELKLELSKRQWRHRCAYKERY